MKLPPFRYHRPETLDEALALLAEVGADGKVLAGGQSLVPLLALRLAHPEHLIDIGRLTELDRLDAGAELTVGAGVRHHTLEHAELTPAIAPLVAEAMPLIGHSAIRSRGTVCGSLAHGDPAAELPAIAIALGATLVVRSVRGERAIPAAEFFLGYLVTALEDDELLMEARFPRSAEATGWSVQELARRHGDFAMVGVAATLQLDATRTITDATLAFFGVDSTPVRLPDAEWVLLGQAAHDDAFAEAATVVTKSIEPPDDIHATAAYRRHVAGILTRRALAEAASRATGAQP